MSILHSGLQLAVREYAIPINTVSDLLPNSKRGVYYISQDNYLICLYDGLPPTLKLYCDSATSCVVVIVVGKDKNGKDIMAISHLSRPGRFQSFFDIVSKVFKGDIKVYAHGANPADPIPNKGALDYTAFRNASIVVKWVLDNKIPIINSAGESILQIIQSSLCFGQGNPAVYSNNLDCYGIQTKDAGVDNNREWLADVERDETGGLQTLFCIFGNADMVRPQSIEFPKDEIDLLVQAAKAANFDEAATMTDEQILTKYSSTPQFEVPWFCDTIRTTGKYVKNLV
ncbi:MAG: hypothetical protein LBQ88_21225 [Treponema sp.]|jgi:hypothetical protein|nr:hypothetical protein [Treponema sp.]